MSEQLREHVSDWSQNVEVAIKERVVKNVALLGAQSANGYVYTEAAMKQAVSLYANRPVFLGHNLANAYGRSARELAGKILNPRFESGRIRGDVQTLDTEAGKLFLELVQAEVSGFGMSHAVQARKSADRKSVESIDNVISVDAVMNPATTKSFSESADDPPDPPKEPQSMTLEELKAQHPGLVTQIESAAITKTKAELSSEAAQQKHATELAEAREKAIAEERKRQADIRALCAEANCADKAEAYCKEGKTVEDVRTALFSEMCKRNSAPSGDSAGDELGEGKDPDKKFKKEYAENRTFYVAHGITEASYIQSRRVDEGLDPVSVGADAKKES